jgi:protein-tyrosine phosphatase
MGNPTAHVSGSGVPSTGERVGVLFVCLGNICRSPIAEGLFLHKVNAAGRAGMFRIDSAGIGDWHAGDPPDHRAIDVARRRGVVLPSRARQVRREDAIAFNHLIAMDESNAEGLLAIGAPRDRVRLMLDFHPATHLVEVPDPYHAGPEAFETVYSLLDAATDGLLTHFGVAPAAKGASQ